MEAKSALVLASIYSRLSLIREALDQAGWVVQPFQNPREALESLRNHPYEAVFCDEQLRGASAGGFLAWTRRLSPELPFYLFGDGKSSQRLHGSSGPTAVLNFPPEEEELPYPTGSSVSTSQAKVAAKVPLEGNTSLVALSDLLEMMGIASQTAIIELGGGQKGLIYVDKGSVVHAVSRSGRTPSRGLQALAELILLEDAHFRVLPYKAPSRSSINLPAAGAMTEAARLADEQQRYQRFIEAVRAVCPNTTAIAAGYPLAKTPSHGFGDADRVFETARKLLEQHRELLGGQVKEACVITDRQAHALILFGEGNLLTATAPPADGQMLFSALRNIVGWQG